MELQLKNIGMITEANVKIDGLTVIAGENDTGKSTVGKITFCIIKAISRYKEDFNESKIYKIEELLEKIFFFIRPNLDFDDSHDEIFYEELKNILSINFYLKYIDNHEYYIELLKEKLTDLKQDDVRTRDMVKKLLDELEYIIKTPENINISIENALNKVFRSEFNSSIVSFGKDIGYIRLVENNLTLLDLKIENDKVYLVSDCEPISINEVTFIETPFILNNHDLLIRSKTGLDITKRSSRRLGVPYTTLHTKDLFDKLKDNGLGFWLDREFEDKIQNEISNIINGKVEYDIDEKDFVYIKNNQKISIKNTATGIKSFGIIQMLLENGFIDTNTLLILDEPEIHIHPKWQLKYAQLISLLVDNGVPVIITSHSPYMIEALKRYSDKEEQEEKTNFYLAEDGYIKQIEESNSKTLEKIFEKLSEPFDVFEEMDSQSLGNLING